jgi:hypothetical protein
MLMKRLATSSVLAVVVVASIVLTVDRSDAAPTDAPLPVTPYAGFNPSLTRAPYVTDVTETSAYVNWATSSSTPGSVQVAPAVNGFCPTATTAWSSSAIPAPSTLPGPVNPTAAAGTMTTASFTVTGNLGTTSEKQWSVPLSGLAAGAEYCYAVFSSDSSGATDLLPSSRPDQMFTTLEPAGSTKSLTFDVTDDLGETYYATGVGFPNNLNSDQAALDQEIGSSGARFLILAGDTAYNSGTQSNYGDLEQTGTEVSDMFGPSYWPQTDGIPTFKTDGDHGLNVENLQVWPTPVTASTSGGTYALDTYPASSVDGTTATNNPDTWYAIQSGDVRLYVLDASWNEQTNQGNATGSACSPSHAPVSGCQQYQIDYDKHWTTSSPEYKWLAADLAAHPGGVKMAVFHYPLRSDNSSQPSDVYLQNSSSNPNQASSLESLLSANGVDLAFNGHAHTYQRIDPGQPGQITNYVTGGGGGVLEPVDGGAGCDNPGAKDVYALGWSPSSNTGSSCGATAPAGSSLSAADVYNFLQVTVNGNQVTVTPTNAAGHTFDVQTYTLGSSGGSSPTTPSNVTAATTSSSVQVNWTASTEAGGTIRSYNVYRNGVQVGAVNAPATGYTDTSIQPNTTYTYSVIAVDTSGRSSTPGTSNTVTTPSVLTPPPSGPAGSGPTACMTHLPAGLVVGAAALRDGSGYYEVDSAGDVAAFGAATCYGAMTGTHLNRPVVGMAVDPATGGYWLVASDGGIFSFNAPFFGSTGAMHLNQPVVGMTASPDGQGYWFVAGDGGIFSFGDAAFYGSTGSMHLNKPVVGMASAPSGHGYWLVASDGGIFAFGSAGFFGSAGSMHLNQPVVNMEATGDGRGYRLIASDGGVFDFGSAPFYGSAGSIRLNRPMIGGADDNATGGYWLMASDGGVFTYNAPFLGSAA